MIAVSSSCQGRVYAIWNNSCDRKLVVFSTTLFYTKFRSARPAHFHHVGLAEVLRHSLEENSSSSENKGFECVFPERFSVPRVCPSSTLGSSFFSQGRAVFSLLRN